ncbi:hypothetical protein WA158_003840 [Blastocystis sp. Blastoise]
MFCNINTLSPHDVSSLQEKLETIQQSMKDLNSYILAPLSSCEYSEGSPLGGISQKVEEYTSSEYKHLKFIEDQLSSFEENILQLTEKLASSINCGSSSSVSVVESIYSQITHYLEPFSKNRSSVRRTLNSLESNKRPVFIPNDIDKKYSIKEDLLKKNRGSLFTELYYDESSRNIHGDIFLNHDDDYFDILFDYMNGKSIDFSRYNEEEKMKLIEQFEYFKLPFRECLLDLREMVNDHKKTMAWNSKVIIVNGRRDDILNNYLYKNNVIDLIFKETTPEAYEYNKKKELYYLNMKLQYAKFIDEYLETNTIGKRNSLKNSMDRLAFKRELEQLHIPLSLSLQTFTGSFYESSMLTSNYIQYLTQWTGEGKQWKLSYRGSEYNFRASDFHRLCDNKGETIVLIKSENNYIDCIFGGYSSVGWINQESKDFYFIRDPQAFLFTLNNPHDVPPTQFKYHGRFDKPLKYDRFAGPCFHGGIYILDECNQDNFSFIECDKLDMTYEQHPEYGVSIFVDTAQDQKDNFFKVDELEIYTRV